MPVINTGGFQVTAQPGIQFLDPRLMTPQYGNILPSIAEGAKLYDQISDYPVKGQLQQLQIQEAQNKLAQDPLSQQLKLAQIAEAQQNAAFPRELVTSTEPLDTTRYEPTAIGEDGSVGEPDKVIGDLYTIEKGIQFGPGGVQTPFERKKLVKDAATRELEQQRVSDLAQYRDVIGGAAETRAQNAALSSSKPMKLGYGTNPKTGNMSEIIMDPITKEITYINTPLQQAQSGLAGALTQILGQGGAQQSPNIAAPATPGAPVFKLNTAPSSPVAAPTIDSDTQTLIDRAAAAFGSPQASNSFQSADSVKAAFRSGALTKEQAAKILREQFGFN